MPSPVLVGMKLGSLILFASSVYYFKSPQNLHEWAPRRGLGNLADPNSKTGSNKTFGIVKEISVIQLLAINSFLYKAVGMRP